MYVKVYYTIILYYLKWRNFGADLFWRGFNLAIFAILRQIFSAPKFLHLKVYYTIIYYIYI